MQKNLNLLLIQILDYIKKEKFKMISKMLYCCYEIILNLVLKGKIVRMFDLIENTVLQMI